MLEKNVEFINQLKVSPWRKFALGTWKNTGDCTVYAVQKIEISAILSLINKINNNQNSNKVTLSAVFGKICSLTLKKYPHLNTTIRMGNIYQRKEINIFYQVAADENGEDLSGCTIRNADQKSIDEIANELKGESKKIKQGQDQNFNQTKKMGKIIPGFLINFFLNFLGLVLYTFNFWHPRMGIKKDCFGSMMITNIGTLGIKMALVPLVSYSRVPLILALGKVFQDTYVKDNQIHIGQFIYLNWTFDHRLIDGVVASQMSNYIEYLTQNPQQLD
jgi:pyruvate/2-oxoglutarate dehydrogenase complex dihydrolipoamide acyltransferase (E2) component